jgi:hypothetical protein
MVLKLVLKGESDFGGLGNYLQKKTVSRGLGLRHFLRGWGLKRLLVLLGGEGLEVGFNIGYCFGCFAGFDSC